ncbi:hypothetical protein Bca101_013406 [Brassica carinata]
MFAGLLSLVIAASSSPGSRSIVRDISGGNADQKDRAVETLPTSNQFSATPPPSMPSSSSSLTGVLPPHYEKVARLFNGPDAMHPGIVLMTRVDCAMEMNTKLCDRFPLLNYPMLFCGPPTKFVSRSGEPKVEKSEIVVIDDAYTAEHLLNWINNHTQSSYGLDDKKFENEHVRSNKTDYNQISQAVYDVEEATAEAFDIILSQKIYPASSRRCRKGAAEILVNYDDLCPSGKCSYEASDGKDTLGNFPICGKDMFCRGRRNDTRGFSCGLWVLFHSLSVRIEDGESHFVFTTICDFVNNFFICDECRLHFSDMCLSVKTHFKKARDFVLCVWSTHNKVNERLMKDEASLSTGDPLFPKILWPPRKLCASCYLSRDQESIELDHDNEKSDIGDREETISANEDLTVTTNALGVPIGAALAIAVASCAFGALACYWRTQQKNRKPRRSWN